jgi:hypothetical protein
MRRRRFAVCACALTLVAATISSPAQRRISEDRDLREIDLTGWDCLNQMGGSAKTPDGAARNKGKNRAPIPLAGLNIPRFDTASFLRAMSTFEAQTNGKRRKDLGAAQLQQLATMEKQLVSLTAYLVIAYAGPPESTNCGSVDFHDWHLELFERPLDHPPGIGDPTPIICEITPRTQSAIYRDGVRLQNLAAFIRRPDIESDATGHPAQRVRITGFLTWDDEHNGTADIGTRISTIAKNKYHQPWRSTAWEIHPVLQIEPADGGTFAAPSTPATMPSAVAAAGSDSTPPTNEAAPAPQPANSPVAPQQITIVEAVKIKIPYGETILQRGMKLPLISRDAQNARVNFMGQIVTIPLRATDLR